MLWNLIFPDILEIPQDIINKYKKRNTSWKITRIAPSPTWFLHIWAVYSTLIDYIFAKKSDWVVYIRIEDTDQKREVEWRAKEYIRILKKFWLNFDEWPIWESWEDIWEYGPYTQSEREYIYKVFIKDWLNNWFAYPCFLTEEEIESIREIQQASKAPTWIYKEYSAWRFASIDDIKKALEEGKEYVIRFKSPWEIWVKIDVVDEIKWKITMQENFLDIVICKKNWLPTYHFAHLIDDYLMQTTHVIRWDEWFASLPLHFQLFQTMNWQPPKYAHYWPLVKIDWDSRRKLSKRYDPERAVEYYFEKWYLVESIIDFLSNIINSWFEDWRKQNLYSSYLDFDFKIEKINTSGALIDIDKLNFVNASIIKNYDTLKLYDFLSNYLKQYFSDFYQNIFSQKTKEYNKSILKELQTRLNYFSEFESLTTYFYNDFEITENIKNLLINPKMKVEDLETAISWLKLWLDIIENNYFETYEDLKNIFVENIKNNWLKNWQVLWPLRVSLSWEEFSVWALELIFILWKEKSIQRLQKILKLLK